MNTDDIQFQRIERERKQRENELYLLLLLLWDESRLHGQAAIRLGHDPIQAAVQVIDGNPALDLPGAIPPIAAVLCRGDIAGQRRAMRLCGTPTHEVETAQATDIEPAYIRPAAQVAQSLIAKAREVVPTEIEDEPVGLSIRQQVKIFRETMNEAWGPNKGNLANLASGAVLEAHGDGMWKGYEAHPNLIGFRHYSIIDPRTTIICRERNLLTLEKDDPYWTSGGRPPLHFGCRSCVLPVLSTDKNVRWSTSYPETPPHPGFGRAPLGAMLLDR